MEHLFTHREVYQLGVRTLSTTFIQALRPQTATHTKLKMASLPSYPNKSQFVGTKLNGLPTPSVVLDLAKVEVNCQRMLDAVRRLDLGWRPHIKTHKVSSGPRLGGSQ